MRVARCAMLALLPFLIAFVAPAGADPADSARVARLLRVIRLGTEPSTVAAVDSLASMNGAVASDALIRLLHRWIPVPDVTSYPTLPPYKDSAIPHAREVGRVVDYFASAQRTWSPPLTDSLVVGLMATIDYYDDWALRPRLYAGKVHKSLDSDRWVIVDRAPAEYLGSPHYPSFPEISRESVYTALARIKRSPATGVLYNLGIMALDPTYPGDTRNMKDGGRLLKPSIRASNAVVDAVIASQSQGYVDSFVVVILQWTGATCCVSGKRTQLCDAFTLAAGEGALASPVRYLQDACSAGRIVDRAPRVVEGMVRCRLPFSAAQPFVRLLACMKPEALRALGPDLAGRYPGNEEMAVQLARVGDMSMREALHALLRREEAAVRMNAADAMLEGGALDDRDLEILDFLAGSDPDPKVRRAVSQGLAIRKAKNGHSVAEPASPATAMEQLYEGQVIYSEAQGNAYWVLRVKGQDGRTVGVSCGQASVSGTPENAVYEIAVGDRVTLRGDWQEEEGQKVFHATRIDVKRNPTGE